MSWPGNWSGNYMPLGLTSNRGDGTIERSNQPPSHSAFPLMDNPYAYDPTFGQSPPLSSGFTQSPPLNFETPRGPNSDSSSATLLGGDYFQCMSSAVGLSYIC